MRSALLTLLLGWHYVLATSVALAVAVWTLRPLALGDASMYPNGDSLAFVAWIQNIVETGWYETGDRLNAPYSQNLHGFALTDELVMGAIGKVLAPLLGSASAATNWWVTLTYPMSAITAVYLARYFGLSRAVSVVPGIAFALLPDHLLRTTGHFSLATTWVVPVGLLAAISLLHPPRFGGRRQLLWHAALLLGLVCTTLTSAYYAVFSGILIMVAGVAAGLRDRSPKPLGHAVLRGAVLGVPLVIGVWIDKRGLPSPLGYEAFKVTRQISDADTYGGRITAMILPPQTHRFETLRDLRQAYDSSFPVHAEAPALGLVAAVGFIGLVLWSMVAFWRPEQLQRRPRLATLAGLTWASLLVYVTGGLGNLWAFALDGGGIRVWSRMHVFIALLALLAVGVVLDRVRRTALRLALVAGVFLVVMLDQTTPLVRPDVEHATALRSEVEELTAAIADEGGRGASVYQYPEVTFLVANRDTSPAGDYDGFLPYVYSDEEDALQWSYGGLQGDPRTDWQVTLGELPLARQAALLAHAGFAGILVDRAALTTSPEELAEIAGLGTPTVVSSSGRWEYYPLPSPGCTGEQESLAADVAVRPPLLYPGPGIDVSAAGLNNDDGDARLKVITLREGGWRKVHLAFTVVSSDAHLEVRLPDGETRTVSPGTSVVEWTGAVRRSPTPIFLDRVSGEGRFTVQDLRATPAVPAGVRACLSEER
jgi:phosphoglycerol transferase